MYSEMQGHQAAILCQRISDGRDIEAQVGHTRVPGEHGQEVWLLLPILPPLTPAEYSAIEKGCPVQELHKSIAKKFFPKQLTVETQEAQEPKYVGQPLSMA